MILSCRLRDLLGQEEESYTQQVADAEETILERQAKMRVRAKSLKENRETERLRYVHSKYDEQWK